MVTLKILQASFFGVIYVLWVIWIQIQNIREHKLKSKWDHWKTMKETAIKKKAERERHLGNGN